MLRGRGEAVVAAVGLRSQAGGILGAVTGVDKKEGNGSQPSNSSLSAPSDGLREQTALERKLSEFAASVGAVGGGAAALVAATLLWRIAADVSAGARAPPPDPATLRAALDAVVTALTVVVVAVPEGLPLAVTLALAFSVKRMLADGALVRRLSSAETMGSATVVCTDKTGTLTTSDMRARRLWLAGREVELGGTTPPPPSLLSSSSSSSSSSSVFSLPPTAAAGRARAHLRDEGGTWEHPLGIEPAEFDALVRSAVLNSTANLRRNGNGNGNNGNNGSDGNGGNGGSVVSATSAATRATKPTSSSSSEAAASVVVGSRTECALLALAVSLGADYEAARLAAGPPLAVLPFSSEAKVSAAAVARKTTRTAAAASGSFDDGDGDDDDGVSSASSSSLSTPVRLYLKGAAEEVLPRCARVLEPGGRGARELTPADREALRLLTRRWERGGGRVLALAARDSSLQGDGGDSRGRAGADVEEEEGEEQEGGSSASPSSSFSALLPTAKVAAGLTLIGLVSLEDPLRAEVPAAVAAIRGAGVEVKMLTGDAPATAAAIALEAGIIDGGGGDESGAAGAGKNDTDEDAPYDETVGGRVMTGADFRRLLLPSGPEGEIDLEAFNGLWPRLRVLARCSPRDKLTIVRGERFLRPFSFSFLLSLFTLSRRHRLTR